MRIKLKGYSLTLNEYELPAIIRENVRIDWVNLNEGRNGDFNPQDENDENLLRFDVSRLEDGQWRQVENGSYCTQVSACTPPHKLYEHLVNFLDTIYNDVSTHGEAKQLCENLSWTK